jgi:cold shock CspA family protein
MKSSQKRSRTRDVPTHPAVKKAPELTGEVFGVPGHTVAVGRGSHTGVVRWLTPDREFGFVELERGGQVFVHTHATGGALPKPARRGELVRIEIKTSKALPPAKTILATMNFDPVVMKKAERTPTRARARGAGRTADEPDEAARPCGRAGADKTARDRFDKLAKRWLAESRHMSDVTAMVMLPSYQEIVGIGPDAVPLMLERLKRAPEHWFWALRAITGANPVPDADRGRVSAMAQEWVNWGHEHGVID